MASSGNKDPIGNLMDKLRSLFGSSGQLKNKAALPPKTRFSISGSEFVEMFVGVGPANCP